MSLIVPLIGSPVNLRIKKICHLKYSYVFGRIHIIEIEGDLKMYPLVDPTLQTSMFGILPQELY